MVSPMEAFFRNDDDEVFLRGLETRETWSYLLTNAALVVVVQVVECRTTEITGTGSNPAESFLFFIFFLVFVLSELQLVQNYSIMVLIRFDPEAPGELRLS